MLSSVCFLEDAEDAQHGLVAMQPAMLAQRALAGAAGDGARLVGPGEIVADQLQHLVAAAIAEDLAADGEVLRQVGVERGEIDAAAGARHFEVAALRSEE